jgi:ArsR family transcriptional regulator
MDDLSKLQAELCKVIANPKRIRIIKILKDGEKSVLEIGKALGISQSNASQHLTIMRAKGVVATRENGREVYYRLSVPELARACEMVGEALRRLKETR